MENISRLCNGLATDLNELTYTPGAYTRFAITDPKLREIYAPSYRDRLAQNWLVMHFGPITERVLIEDTFANRIGKGTLAAIRRVQHFMRQPGHSHYLQLDIYNFFGSIYLPRLLAQCETIFERYFENHPLRDALHHLLKQSIIWPVAQHTHTVSGDRELLATIPQHRTLAFGGPDRGLPLGSAASQMFANLYLSPLDHFIKHRLKVKGYTRYMDDLFLLSDSPSQLSLWREEIRQFTEDELYLRIHPSKQVIQSCHQGADYLGYYTYPHHLHLRRRNISSLFHWLHFFNSMLSGAQCTPDWGRKKADWSDFFDTSTVQPSLPLLHRIQAIINSYLGLMKHARHYRLRKKIYRRRLGRLQSYFLPVDNNYNAVRIRKRFLQGERAQ